jgi:hypothetical protein
MPPAFFMLTTAKPQSTSHGHIRLPGKSPDKNENQDNSYPLDNTYQHPMDKRPAKAGRECRAFPQR